MAAPELDVRYVARLARLELSEEEIARYQAQLSDVLTFVEALRQVDVSAVEPTAPAPAVFNLLRADNAPPGVSRSACVPVNLPRARRSMPSRTASPPSTRRWAAISRPTWKTPAGRQTPPT